MMIVIMTFFLPRACSAALTLDFAPCPVTPGACRDAAKAGTLGRVLERLRASAQAEGSGSPDPSAGTTGPGPDAPSTPAQADVEADKGAHAQLPNGVPGVLIAHVQVHRYIHEVWLGFFLLMDTSKALLDVALKGTTSQLPTVDSLSGPRTVPQHLFAR